MDRFIDGSNGSRRFSSASVALNTFTAVVMRKFFAVTFRTIIISASHAGHPDLLGIAATSYRGTHITVDLVWANGARNTALDRRVRNLVLLFVVTVRPTRCSTRW